MPIAVRRPNGRLLLTALLAATIPSAVVWSQDPVFRAGVSLVRVDAQVTSAGVGVDGLQKEDFLVKDNGQPVTILYGSQDEEPLDLLLLFDGSGSMAPAVRRLAASASTALSELKQGDRLGVAYFNTESFLLFPFTDDLEQAKINASNVVDIRFGGGTHILSAIYDAASYFKRAGDEHRRHAVLVFTDDEGQSSMNEKKAVEHLWENNVFVCGLIIRTPNPMGHFGSESMLGASQKTGGETVNADDSAHPFRDMVRRMRKRYSLYYAMPVAKAGSERKVSIELTGEAKAKYPAGQVLARKGYLIPKQ